MELMQITQAMIPRSQFLDRLIRLIKNLHMTMAMSLEGIPIPLMGKKHILASPFRGLKVRSPAVHVSEARPDQFSFVCEDVGSRLGGSVGSWIRKRAPGVGSDEDIAF